MVTSIETPKRRGRQPRDPNAPQTLALTKRERFLKYGPTRTKAVLRSIRQLKNCLNPGSYEYQIEEWNKILGAIGVAAAELQKEAEYRCSGADGEKKGKKLHPEDGFSL